MKHLKRILGIFVIFVLLPAAYGASQNITVEIDYGGLQQSRKVEITWKQGITVLEALRSVTKIETKQAGEFILVNSIDGVEGKMGLRPGITTSMVNVQHPLLINVSLLKVII